MKITFFQRGQTINARLSDGDKCYRLTTGIKVRPHLKFKKQFVGKTTEVNNLNNELSRFQIRVTELYMTFKDFSKVKEVLANDTVRLPDEDSYELDDLLLRYIQMMRAGEVLSSSKRRYSDATINIYGYAALLMSEFAEFFGPLDLSECHIEGQMPMKKKMEIADYFNNYFKRYEQYLTDRGNSIKTRADILNMTAVMMNYWCNKLFFTVPKLPRLQSAKKPIVVFPPEFVKKFLNDKATYEKLSPELKFIWEVSATILITTLRISDALSLNERNLVFNKDLVFLNKKNQKTGMFSQMPLPKLLTDIYRENLARYGRIYTIEPSREIVYYRIKDLFRLYEDAHEVVTILRYDPRGNEIYESKQLCEWVHPHLLRKTAITTMIYNGVPERFIKFASGHEAKSIAFEDYVGHVDKNFKNEVDNYYDKFLGS